MSDSLVGREGVSLFNKRCDVHDDGQSDTQHDTLKITENGRFAYDALPAFSRSFTFSSTRDILSDSAEKRFCLCCLLYTSRCV